MKALVSGFVASILLLSGCASSSAQEKPQQSATPTPVIKLVILGSGNPVPSRTQAGTSLLVEAGGRIFMFDCGRGCTTRLAQYGPHLLTKIDALFLTHLHSDHIVGIPDLWLNGWTQGRKTPLNIWGPTGTGAMMDGLRIAYASDIGYRTPAGALEDTRLHPAVHIVAKDGVIYDEGGVTITAFRVHHANIPAFGYRIDAGGKSVMISGDTTTAPNLAIYGKGADVALMEVASPPMVDYVKRSFPPAQAAQILALHLDADQAGATFAAIRPKLGVYYHTVSNCSANAALLGKTRDHYEGLVIVSQDLTEISIYSDRIETALPDTSEKCE